MRGMDQGFYSSSYVGQQFLLMILLKHLFPQTCAFKSSLEETRTQHAGIICTHSLRLPSQPTCRSPSAAAGPPPTVTDVLLHPLLLTWGCPRQLWIPVDERIRLSSLPAAYPGDHRKGKTFCLPSFPTAVHRQRPPTARTDKPRRWKRCFVPAPAGLRSRCEGGIPFTPSEEDLCHFHQDTARISEDEHLRLVRSKGNPRTVRKSTLSS